MLNCVLCRVCGTQISVFQPPLVTRHMNETARIESELIVHASQYDKCQYNGDIIHHMVQHSTLSGYVSFISSMAFLTDSWMEHMAPVYIQLLGSSYPSCHINIYLFVSCSRCGFTSASMLWPSSRYLCVLINLECWASEDHSIDAICTEMTKFGSEL
jgi:endogenous inhibitor of DNA gyrase (YacG/DUF329 family)